MAARMSFECNETAQRSATHHANTYRKRRIPVLAKAKARPKIPLPIIALLRLNTDIPREVVPGIWRRPTCQQQLGMKQGNASVLQTPHILQCIRYK